MADSKVQRHKVETRLIFVQVIGDFVFAFVGLLLGYFLRFHTPIARLFVEATVSLNDYLPVMLLGSALLSVAFIYLGLYRWRVLINAPRAAALIIKGTTFWFLTFFLVTLALKFDPSISRIFLGLSWVSCVVFLLVWRFILHRIFGRFELITSIQRNILLIGWSPEADRLASAIAKVGTHPYSLLGCVDTELGASGSDEETHSPTMPKIGRLSQLDDVISEFKPDIVIVVDLDLPRQKLLEISEICEQRYVDLKFSPSMFQIFVSGLQLETVVGVPLLGVEELSINQLPNRVAKRTMDIVGALVGLGLSAPVILILMWMIKRENPGPLFFSQERVGANMKPFKMVKLRSMKVGSEKFDKFSQSTFRHDPRMLKVGSFMRRWNLDELPQFWNVLKGEMSLVGPRPERTYFVNKLSLEIPHYNPRHMVKPGITGWAQVNGLRGDTSLIQRIRYDLYYIENWSVLFDIQVLIMTFLKRDNAY